MNDFWSDIKVILLFLLVVAITTFVVISSMGCHPSPEGWGLWFFVFLGGFCLLGS